jgi:hypothetical protein
MGYEQNVGLGTMAVVFKITIFNSDESWIQAPLLANARSQ